MSKMLINWLQVIAGSDIQQQLLSHMHHTFARLDDCPAHTGHTLDIAQFSFLLQE